MKKYFLILFSLFFILNLTACREKKFREVDKKRTEQRIERIKYINIYNVNYTSRKTGKFYTVFVELYANNISNKNIYWFQVLVNIFSKGKLTHSIIYTPNYYKKRGSDIKYYRILAPKQSGKFKIILGNSYKIESAPDLVKLEVFDVGDNIDIFKKIRVNPKKYFIPYSPGD